MLKIKYLSFIISVFVLTFFAGYLIFAQWQDAPPDPPGNNVDVPLNVSSNPQIKSGGLELGSLIIRGGASFNTEAGNVEIGGNIIASNNVWDDCQTLAWTCDPSQECPDGKFIVNVQRYTTGSLCGSAWGNQWYQMRIKCCSI